MHVMNVCGVAEPYPLIKQALAWPFRKPLLYLTMVFLGFLWSHMIDAKAAHETIWASGGTDSISDRKGIQAQGWLLSWARSDALDAVWMWILVETTTVVFSASSLGLEKFSCPEISARLCWSDACHNMSYSGIICTNLNKSVQLELPHP